jgi:hypothetical protein
MRYLLGGASKRIIFDHFLHYNSCKVQPPPEINAAIALSYCLEVLSFPNVGMFMAELFKDRPSRLTETIAGHFIRAVDLVSPWQSNYARPI